ncbi:MAG: YdeI/OmpD-associated family protein [Parvibaculaceae bacterium]
MPKAPAHGTRLKRAAQPMPAFVKEALAEAGLTARYRERPPYQRNDYLLWINSAKLAATKQKRLDQMLAELKSGGVYMGMAWRGREKA